MRFTASRLYGVSIGGVLLLSFLGSVQVARGEPPESLRRGRELFERIWEPTKGLKDGLGPMYNERSCIACHFLGGIGGAGAGKHNVELLTPQPVSDTGEMHKLFERLRMLHPGFTAGVTVILHRFSTNDNYRDFRAGLLGHLPPPDAKVNREIFLRAVHEKQGDGPIKTITTREQDRLLLSERNTTPIFGAGLIDTIPVSVLKRVAEEQPNENPNVTGRLVGRFGWRGQIGTLKDFVLGACAVEVGLEVPGHAQGVDPLHFVRGPRIKDFDMTPAECDDLVAFIAGLPKPRRLPPVDAQEVALVKNGEALFETVGCAVCHRPKLGNVAGIYSDLLLHDLGAELEDPSPALESLPLSGSAQYYSSVDTQSLLVESRRREWKTPPLWGLRDSGPYLHDGRAQTVEAAIYLHGGEARSSVDSFRFLPFEEQRRLLLFLSKLTGPDAKQLAKYAKPPEPVRPRVAPGGAAFGGFGAGVF